MAVPELRFRREDGTEYQEWEERRLGDVILIQRGGSPRPISDYITSESNGLNWIKIGDVSPDKNVITHTKEKIKPEGLNKTRKVFPGDLILSNSMSFGRPYIVKIEGCIHDGWLLLRDNTDSFVQEYLCAVLGIPQTILQYEKLSAGSTVRNLNCELVQSVAVPVPCLEEQQKIASFLSDLETVISASEAEVTALEQQKKGLMQMIFLQKVRFRRDDGTEYPEWEEKCFGELYKQITEKNDGSFGTDKVISVANMYFKSDATVGSEEYLKTYNVCRLGDIAFEGNKSKRFAHGRFVENVIGDGIVSHVFVTFRPVNKTHNLLYWKYVINYEPIMGRILIKCTKKSTMMTDLVVSDFLKQVIPVPCLEEQQKIASLLSDMDAAIDLAKRELAQWKLLKKGLMQRMFV